MSGTPWSMGEVRYLEQHQREGAEAIARALGRSIPSVKWQAHSYGISLRVRWMCPLCGHEVFKPLNDRTGWCATCTKAARREVLEEQLRTMADEKEREKAEDRARQALYSRKNRMIRRINQSSIKHDEKE